MSENKTIKILIILLVVSLLLTLFGLTEYYELLRWEVLMLMIVLGVTALSSRRYYWGVIFVLFGLIFNPFYPPSLSKFEWRITDVLLIFFLACWFWDYFFNYHKGLLFERFIKNKFPEQDWVFVNYTKDLYKKFHQFVESDTNPDFQFRSRLTGKNIAIECKYRSEYWVSKQWGEGIHWSKDQGDRYLRYARENNAPVYIAVGIGGNPKSPKVISFIPLDLIQKQYFYFIPKEVIERNQKPPTV
jgi:hypothetical protein